MTSPQKAKGSAYEREVAAYLRDNGFPQADQRYGGWSPEWSSDNQCL
jgi:Holliday junction resolvase